MDASTEWTTPVLAEIDDRADYLVKTNGGEWRDPDLHMWAGYRVKHMLGDNIVRGRPVLIARVIDPGLSALLGNRPPKLSD
jgi:hypothetical protein